ncbi:MAG: hypothetical protein IIW27_05620 [Clostridia bacterium]|nr:hypothetical protein [Clostridia bacterium]
MMKKKSKKSVQKTEKNACKIPFYVLGEEERLFIKTALQKIKKAKNFETMTQVVRFYVV